MQNRGSRSPEAGVGGMHQLASSKPGSSWQSPHPQLSASRLRLINQPSFPYLFLEVCVFFCFCIFFFPESISDVWVALLEGDQEDP